MAAADTEPKLDEFVGEDSMGACVKGACENRGRPAKNPEAAKNFAPRPVASARLTSRPSSPRTHLTDEEEFVEEVGKEKKLTVSVESARLEKLLTMRFVCFG
jgi:hypothetical protein